MNTENPQAAAVLVLDEVRQERARQEEKWGVQRHPSLDLTLLKREGGCTPERMAEHFEIPSEARGKFLCQNAYANGEGTWAHIAIEEMAEAVGCMDDERKMREELIQLAAVAVAWVEDIDRRNPAS